MASWFPSVKDPKTVVVTPVPIKEADARIERLITRLNLRPSRIRQVNAESPPIVVRLRGADLLNLAQVCSRKKGGVARTGVLLVCVPIEELSFSASGAACRELCKRRCIEGLRENGHQREMTWYYEKSTDNQYVALEFLKDICRGS